MAENKGSQSPAPVEPPGGLDARFCEAMDAAPVMIWVSGRDGLCTWFNRPWLAFTGRSMAQEIGQGWAEGVHPEDFERCLAIYLEHFHTHKTFRMSYRLRHRSGEYRWIDDAGIPRQALDGSFLGFIGSCTDIDDSRRVEDALRGLKKDLEERVAQSAAQLKQEIARREEALAQAIIGSAALGEAERRFRLLVEGVVDYAIYLLDPDGTVTDWNLGAERIKGYRGTEIIGGNFRVFFTEEDIANGLPEKVLETAAREGRFESEGWRVRKDGTRFWANAVVDAIRDESGELIGFAKITRDMSEWRDAQDELNHAREQLFQMQKFEAVGQLTGGIAHDFNNLLTIVIGNVELAQRNLEQNATVPRQQIARLLGNALTGAKRAATLTQRLLAFARRQPLDAKPLNVNKFIAGMGEFLQRTLGEQIDIEAVGGGGLWQVEIDPVQLESAILNLALNSRDAMPDGGKLTIEANNVYLDQHYGRINPEIAPGQYVAISISDTGMGMTRETLSRAFEPFFTTKTVGHGTGLGLSQVYGFVKQSGGTVKVYSEVGEGTTVKLYLPRLVREAANAESESSQPVATGGGETILVAEDDPAVLEYVVEVLKDLDYQVLQAADGISALKYLQNEGLRIDLLLSDVVMPGMNGRALADQARQLKPGIKILFMTGYSQNAIVHQGRLDSGVQLIQKPLSQAQLASRIRDLLDDPSRA